jgi:thioredoxin domain-containing protein 10
MKHEITLKNKNQLFSFLGMWFVEFYAPFCGFCKKLEPIWNLVAQTLYNTNIRVGKVDCTRFKTVCHAFEIQGYPTVIL